MCYRAAKVKWMTHPRGFVFIELVVVMSMVGILAVLSFSVGRQMVSRENMRLSRAQLVSSLQGARLLALASHEPMQLVPTPSWQEGYRVKALSDAFGMTQAYPGIRLKQVFYEGFPRHEAPAFDADGSSMYHNGHFSLGEGDVLGTIVLNQAGRIRKD